MAVNPVFFLDILGVGFAITALSLLLTYLMIRVGIQDQPGRRSSHKIPTPRSGGVAIAGSFAVGIVYLLISHHLTYISLTRVVVLAFAAGVICWVSLQDDIKELSFAQKFIVQIVTASLIVIIGLSITEIPLPFIGVVSLKAFGGILSALWIIFFMNVFNFMDGLNGLASGVSLIASFFCALLGILFAESSLFYVSFALFFSTLGFFIFNFPKGKIFMGDIGSQFLGLVWSIVLFIPIQPDHMSISVYTVPLLFFAFIYDVSITVARRVWNRDTFWLAHRTHLFQLLNRLGYSHKQVTYLHLGVAVLQGLGAIILQHIPDAHQIFIFIPYLVLMMGYHGWIYRQIHQKIVPYRQIKKRKKE